MLSFNHQRPLRQDEAVLIQAAAGGVGVAAVQLARDSGATVIAVASGPERQSRLAKLGAAYVIERHVQDVVTEVRQSTNGKGADPAIDPVGSTLEASFSALSPEGRLVFLGNALEMIFVSTVPTYPKQPDALWRLHGAFAGDANG
ncbi:zinc-binding dehydrogenase [Agrobacterium pusense]|uniref:zinc-binding dehydrogenase n=1 Tax=Agrobacterium pusense TaxID=648995 RepID=UPI00384E9A79